MGQIDDILQRLTKTRPGKTKSIIEKLSMDRATKFKFVPNPGPQTQAYYSEADILLYGGQAGGGKSQLLLGLACEAHQRSIIFRREGSQLDGLESDGKKIIGNAARYNASNDKREWTWPRTGRSVKLAGMKEPEDWQKHAGRERDLMAFDEGGDFLERQVSSLFAWNRGPQGQRCRVVLASNPPRNAEGLWMLKWFAPWLDRNYSNPAAPGELRWACLVDRDGKGSLNIEWVEGPGQYDIEGNSYGAMSLTFIPASLTDNPYRNTEEYKRKLQALPEPLRSQLLYGDFNAGTKDVDYQVIPTDWVIAAQNRWTNRRPTGMGMSAIAVDPAGGGADAEEIAYRYGGWFGEIVSTQGKETEDGSQTAANVVRLRRDGCPVVVDVGGGYGGQCIMRLDDNGIKAQRFNGANASFAKTIDGTLKYANKRAEAYWKLREALDPNQEGGSVIALPPSAELRSDLTSATWKLGPKGLQLEAKDDIKKKLGRSPGKGDAVAMCYAEGERAIMRKHLDKGNRPKVVMGHLEKRVYR